MLLRGSLTGLLAAMAICAARLPAAAQQFESSRRTVPAAYQVAQPAADPQAEDCRPLKQAVRPLSGSTIDITPKVVDETGDRPLVAYDTPSDCARLEFKPELALPASNFPTRGWAVTSYEWTAPRLQHRPLYFEDVPLERYGQSRHPLVQPAVSAGRFFTTVPMLPYLMWLERPGECLYALGHHRPGSCAPPVRQRPPFSAGATAFEVAVGAGLFFLIP
jgi:hypothetical protein